jgi:UDP-hydrolysing UDP-N-acetyl-D-glucosamine 2-epimerase
MAITLAASYLNIPVVHTPGGEITGSIDDKVRHATTKIADYHMVATERSRKVVERFGEPEDRVYLTGGPSNDVVADIVDADENGPYDPQPEYDGVGDDIDVTERYVVVQYHPVHTDYQSEYEKAWEVLTAVERLDTQVFWFWPNMDAGNDEISRAIRKFREEVDPPGWKFFVNLHPKDYLRLVKNSACQVGNSSVAVRECSFLGQPAVNVGERQQYRERAENVVDVACDADEIVAAVREQMAAGEYPQSTLYGDGRAGERIKDVIVDTDLTLKSPMTLDLLGLDDAASPE